MPRKPRFYLPGIPVHLVQRGHNRDPVFFEEEDYRTYLSKAGEAAQKYRCAIHAYVLMTNHIHLLLTPEDAEGPARFMQYVGRHYVPFINHKYGKSGSIWEGRYKASLVDEDNYLLTCMRYIELNPVRANMVDHPAAYTWSSYRHNGYGEHNRLLQSHSLYLALGRTRKGRQEAYEALFHAHIEPGMLKELRSAVHTGTPLGNDAFRSKVERTLGCKVGQPRRGRPTGMKMKKPEGDGAQIGIKGLGIKL
jgi:putative transposase